MTFLEFYQPLKANIHLFYLLLFAAFLGQFRNIQKLNGASDASDGTHKCAFARSGNSKNTDHIWTRRDRTRPSGKSLAMAGGMSSWRIAGIHWNPNHRLVCACRWYSVCLGISIHFHDLSDITYCSECIYVIWSSSVSPSSRAFKQKCCWQFYSCDLINSVSLWKSLMPNFGLCLYFIFHPF